MNVSEAAVELGPPEAAWVAVTVWLALLRGEVGVKLQALLETGAVSDLGVPSIETVTVSPLTPVSGDGRLGRGRVGAAAGRAGDRRSRRGGRLGQRDIKARPAVRGKAEGAASQGRGPEVETCRLRAVDDLQQSGHRIYEY